MMREGGGAASTQWDQEEQKWNTDNLLGCVLVLLTHCIMKNLVLLLRTVKDMIIKAQIIRSEGLDHIKR